MGDNEQAVLEAQLAKEEEEAEAAAQQRMLIGVGVGMIVITALVVVVLRKRIAKEEDVPKDFAAGGMPPGMPDMSTQPGMPDMSAQPASSVTPEPVVEPLAAQPEPAIAPAEPSVVQQWTDENGNTWRVMTDGTNRWWNGTDWQKV